MNRPTLVGGMKAWSETIGAVYNMEQLALELARIKKVQRNRINIETWSEQALYLLRFISIVQPSELGKQFNCDELRQYLLQMLDLPAHPNMWGALFTNAIRQNVIKKANKREYTWA